MSNFYALILGWDAASANPSLTLVQTAKTVAELEAVTDYDPAGPFSTVVRGQFQCTKVEDHDIKNDFSGHVDAAAIYEMAHL